MTQSSALPAQRFTLDTARAGDWLRHAEAAYRAAAYDEEPPADLQGPKPEGELPGIDSEWNPVDPGQEDEVFLLVRRAVDAGIISAPADADLDFEYVADDDGGYYCFLVRVCGGRLKLASTSYEMRKLGERDATGTAAALAILDEAVWSANSVLANLEKYAADHTGAPLTAGYATSLGLVLDAASRGERVSLRAEGGGLTEGTAAGPLGADGAEAGQGADVRQCFIGIQTWHRGSPALTGTWTAGFMAGAHLDGRLKIGPGSRE